MTTQTPEQDGLSARPESVIQVLRGRLTDEITRAAVAEAAALEAKATLTEAQEAVSAYLRALDGEGAPEPHLAVLRAWTGVQQPGDGTPE